MNADDDHQALAQEFQELKEQMRTATEMVQEQLRVAQSKYDELQVRFVTEQRNTAAKMAEMQQVILQPRQATAAGATSAAASPAAARPAA